MRRKASFHNPTATLVRLDAGELSGSARRSRSGSTTPAGQWRWWCPGVASLADSEGDARGDPDAAFVSAPLPPLAPGRSFELVDGAIKDPDSRTAT